jgi:hypothetical protein
MEDSLVVLFKFLYSGSSNWKIKTDSTFSLSFVEGIGTQCIGILACTYPLGT